MKIHRKSGGFNEKIKLGEDIDYVHRLSKIAKFGLLRNVCIPVSVRRLDEDGRFKIVVKYVAAEVHLIFLGRYIPISFITHSAIAKITL